MGFKDIATSYLTSEFVITKIALKQMYKAGIITRDEWRKSKNFAHKSHRENLRSL